MCSVEVLRQAQEDCVNQDEAVSLTAYLDSELPFARARILEANLLTDPVLAEKLEAMSATDARARRIRCRT